MTDLYKFTPLVHTRRIGWGVNFATHRRSHFHHKYWSSSCVPIVFRTSSKTLSQSLLPVCSTRLIILFSRSTVSSRTRHKSINVHTHTHLCTCLRTYICVKIGDDDRTFRTHTSFSQRFNQPGPSHPQAPRLYLDPLTSSTYILHAPSLRILEETTTTTTHNNGVEQTTSSSSHTHRMPLQTYRRNTWAHVKNPRVWQRPGIRRHCSSLPNNSRARRKSIGRRRGIRFFRAITATCSVVQCCTRRIPRRCHRTPPVIDVNFIPFANARYEYYILCYIDVVSIENTANKLS